MKGGEHLTGGGSPDDGMDPEELETWRGTGLGPDLIHQRVCCPGKKPNYVALPRARRRPGCVFAERKESAGKGGSCQST